jgi:glycosyltransferase involved in cell wall biosynthesis
MKVLQICNKPPYPPTEGGSMAMHAVTRMLLQQHFSVKVLAMESPKCPVRLADIPEEYRQQTGFEWVFVDTRLHPFAALRALLRNQSYHAVRFYSKTFELRLKEILQAEQYDIIQLETVYPAVYLPLIRSCSGAKVIIRAHNIEHKIWERIASHTRNPFKKAYLRILSRQLQRFELDALRQVDGIETISPVDSEYFKEKTETPVCVIPFGIPSRPLQPQPLVEPHRLFSLASMNWKPNEEGIRWFVRESWPLIRQRHPNAEFRIAGRHTPPHFLAPLPGGIRIVGEVEDSEAFMRESGILVVPLLSGSGIRIKILEAMSLGVTIISTSIGAEGIPATHKENILIADTPQAFADAVSFCIKFPEECRRIGERAADFVRQNYNEEVIAGRLMEFLTECKI